MILKRAYTDNGTFGKLYDDNNNFICYTVEQIWANNEPFLSCIPEGEYSLIPFHSKKYGETVALVNHYLNVFENKIDSNSRYACLIHSANYAGQLQGCIAPGLELGIVSGNWAVTNSRAAFKKLQNYFNEKLIIES